MKERYEVTTTDASTTMLMALMARKDVPPDVIQQFSMFAIRLRRELGNERVLEHDRQHAHDFQSMATLLEEAVIPQEQRLLKAEAGLAQLTLNSTAAQEMLQARVRELEMALQQAETSLARVVIANTAAQQTRDARIIQLEEQLNRQQRTNADLQEKLQQSTNKNTLFQQKIEQLEKVEQERVSRSAYRRAVSPGWRGWDPSPPPTDRRGLKYK